MIHLIDCSILFDSFVLFSNFYLLFTVHPELVLYIIWSMCIWGFPRYKLYRLQKHNTIIYVYFICITCIIFYIISLFCFLLTFFFLSFHTYCIIESFRCIILAVSKQHQNSFLKDFFSRIVVILIVRQYNYTQVELMVFDVCVCDVWVIYLHFTFAFIRRGGQTCNYRNHPTLSSLYYII